MGLIVVDEHLHVSDAWLFEENAFFMCFTFDEYPIPEFLVVVGSSFINCILHCPNFVYFLVFGSWIISRLHGRLKKARERGLILLCIIITNEHQGQIVMKLLPDIMRRSFHSWMFHTRPQDGSVIARGSIPRKSYWQMVVPWLTNSLLLAILRPQYV